MHTYRYKSTLLKCASHDRDPSKDPERTGPTATNRARQATVQVFNPQATSLSVQKGSAIEASRSMKKVDGINKGDKLLLKWKGTNVAVLEASSIWKPNKASLQWSSIPSKEVI